jgi:hypothetical protein
MMAADYACVALRLSFAQICVHAAPPLLSAALCCRFAAAAISLDMLTCCFEFAHPLRATAPDYCCADA